MGQIDQGRIENAVTEIIEALGEDVDREGLQETPERVARFYAEVFGGIHIDPGNVIDAFFGDEHYQEIVMVREIPFYSMCEHHFVPFHGQAHVAYMPRGRSYRSVQAGPPRRRLCPSSSDAGEAHGSGGKLSQRSPQPTRGVGCGRGRAPVYIYAWDQEARSQDGHIGGPGGSWRPIRPPAPRQCLCCSAPGDRD